MNMRPAPFVVHLVLWIAMITSLAVLVLVALQ
jgi:hypothetical protein